MTEIRNTKYVLRVDYLNLEFICVLVLVFWDLINGVSQCV